MNSMKIMKKEYNRIVGMLKKGKHPLQLKVKEIKKMEEMMFKDHVPNVTDLICEYIIRG